MSVYMCDFETTTKEEDCRVWAACAVDINDGTVAHLSNNLESFMEWLQQGKSKVCYFHNLRFDGEFILPWLFNNGFKHVDNVDKNGEPIRKLNTGEFQTLVSDMGQFFKITIMFERKKKKIVRAEIYDSLKKLPFKVAKIAKDFGLEKGKGEIDYTLDRAVGYQITPEEEDYIVTDCKIVQQALSYQLNEGMKKMTIAADSLNSYKEIVGRSFEYWFPTLPKIVDDDIRKAYKGGYTYCDPRKQNQIVHEGIVLDVNSLYPDCMFNCLLPYGYPVYFEGEPTPDEMYPLFIVRIRCAFRLKPDHIPIVQIKRGIFQESEYLESSTVTIDGHDELIEVDLTLTSVDLELFFNHYDVENLEYISGFKFKGQTGMFKEYIDHWMHIKETSPSNSAQRAIAKLHLNSLYGKFASSTERLPKVPVMCPDGIVRYYCYNEPARDEKGNILFYPDGRIKFKTDQEGHIVPREPELVDPVYTPVGAFITAWARHKTITAAQKCYDRFLYCDTDSLHLLGHDVPEGLEVHDTKLGAWKIEGRFTQAKFLRAKTYMETIDGKNHVTCAGMPDNVKEAVNYRNFVPGARFPGKLLPKRVKGGVILEAVDFTIHL